MSQRIQPFRFNFEQQAWAEVRDSGRRHEIAPHKVKIATHNVLKPMSWWLEWAIRTPERYAHEMIVLKELNADIIGLNEVSLQFMRVLLEQSWVRENYYVSDVFDDEGTNTRNKCTVNRREFGNFMLMRFYPHIFTSYMLPDNPNRDVLTATFFENEKELTVCSAHTTAFENLAYRRETQLRQLCEYLQDPQIFNRSNNIIIMGDLNLHLLQENRIIEENGYVDFWKPTPNDLNGFSWDTSLNGLIWFLFLDRRRMRLDRIISHKNSKWSCDPVIESGLHLFAKDPIYPSWYLFCSDHFGLVTDIVFSP